MIQQISLETSGAVKRCVATKVRECQSMAEGDGDPRQKTQARLACGLRRSRTLTNMPDVGLSLR